MEIHEIETVVDNSVKLRVPTFQRDDRAARKIERLEDYLLACAFARGDLEAVRRWAARLVTNLEDKWDDFEVELPKGATVREHNLAKKAEHPDIYAALAHARQLRQDIDRQISRLTHDEATSSRAYTFITGNG